MFGRLSSLLSLPGLEKGTPRASLGEGRLPRLSSQSRGSGAGGWGRWSGKGVYQPVPDLPPSPAVWELLMVPLCPDCLWLTPDVAPLLNFPRIMRA